MRERDSRLRVLQHASVAFVSLPIVQHRNIPLRGTDVILSLHTLVSDKMTLLRVAQSS